MVRQGEDANVKLPKYGEGRYGEGRYGEGRYSEGRYGEAKDGRHGEMREGGKVSTYIWPALREGEGQLVYKAVVVTV